MYKAILIESKEYSDIQLGMNGVLYLENGESIVLKKYQHIILIDTEAKILTDDWYYDCESKTVLQCDIDQIKAETCSKVLSTTSKEVDLPQVSNKSKLLFIDYYNKYGEMPKSVDIEKEEDLIKVYDNVGVHYWGHWEINPKTNGWKLKCNQQGEVDITIPENKLKNSLKEFKVLLESLSKSELKEITETIDKLEEPEYKETIYPKTTKREGDYLRVYGAGKFQEESLVLNKDQAALLLIDLLKFIDMPKDEEKLYTEEEVDQKLNYILNDVLCVRIDKNLIESPNSNKIAEFVTNWTSSKKK